MENCAEYDKPKILILATLSGGYAGADSVGQLHADYPNNTFILPVICPSMDAGGGPERAAQLINQTYPLMKEHGIDTRRLKLAAICTVCTKPFLKEVTQMDQLLDEIGYVKDEMEAFPGLESVAA